MFLVCSQPLPLAANYCPDFLFIVSPKQCLSNQSHEVMLQVEK